MRICCFVGDCAGNRDDQYVTSRGEGRAIINQAFGLGLLGHEVEVISLGFEDGLVDPRPELNGNVTLKHSPSGYYDFCFTYNSNPMHPDAEYGKLMYYIEPSNNEAALTALKDAYPGAQFLAAAKLIFPSFNEDMGSRVGVDYKHSAILFPLPSFPKLDRQDFQEFKFDVNKKDINVFAYISGWPHYFLNCDRQIYNILVWLRDNHGFNIHLTILRGGKGNQFTADASKIVSEFRTSLTCMQNEEVDYWDILNMLHEQDICITKGGWPYCGMCSFDIVSMGKLMFYTIVGQGQDAGHNINDMWALNEWVFPDKGNPADCHALVDKILANPEEAYGAFKEAIDHQRYPVWSIQMEALLEECKVVKEKQGE